MVTKSSFRPIIVLLTIAAAAGGPRPLNMAREPMPLELIRPSADGTHFVCAPSGRTMVIWGVNYDHDDSGQLLEDYWHEAWETVVEDFQEIKRLGANAVRVHLQVAKFMDTAEQPNQVNLERLAQLVQLAEETRLYLDVTGLGCYHKQDVPPWYDELDEAARWQVQARFWQAIAKVCKDSPTVFCYDLMNEPVLPGAQKETSWLAGEPLGGKYFVQRITLDLAGRTRTEVAQKWVATLAAAIREVDERHMITVGVIPWGHVFPGAKPLFYSPAVGGPLDFVSVHFYPQKDKVPQALAALAVYNIGKPLVVEEIFPLQSSVEEVEEFIDGSCAYTDGWFSFYWGKTIAEYQQQADLRGALMAAWLESFRANSP